MTITNEYPSGQTAMTSNDTSVWCPAIEAVARLRNSRIGDGWSEYEIPYKGVISGNIPARGKKTLVDKRPDQAVFYKDVRKTLPEFTPINRKTLQMLAIEDDTRHAEFFEWGMLVAYSKTEDQWSIFHDVEIMTRSFDHYISTMFQWNSSGNVGRPRAAAQWTSLLEIVLKLERASLLNNVSCPGRKDLLDLILSLSADPLDERTIEHDVSMIWNGFVKNYSVERPGGIEAFRREQEGLDVV